ncbi:hypothetical protein [Sphingomonas sp.]
MSSLTEATAALNQLAGLYAQTRDQLADIAGGPADGGPNFDGWYPLTRPFGETVFVPSIAKLLSLTAAARGPLMVSWAELYPLAETSAIGDEYSVDAADNGSHIEPGIGSPVPNSGTYRLVAGTPNYFKRTGSLLTVDVAATLAEIAGIRDTIRPVVDDLEGDNNIGAVADALAAIDLVAANIGEIIAAAPPEPRTIIGTRTLTAEDYHKRLMLNIPTLLDDGVAEIRLPSNSVDPLPIGIPFKLYYKGGAAVRFAQDAAGEAQFVGLSVSQYALSTALHWVEVFQEETNVWRFSGAMGEAGNVLEPGTHGVLLDFADFDTLRQDTAGTIPVTALGQTVCWVRNKGTYGGQAVAPANDRGFTIELVDGVYMLVPASATSALRLASAAGMSLAEMDLFVGFKVLQSDWASLAADKGFIAFQSSTNTAIGQNDGAYIVLQGNNTLACRAGSPPAVASALGIMSKYPHVMELHKPGNTADLTIYIDGAGGTAMPGTTNASAVDTSLTTLARDLIFGAAQANNAEGIGNYGNVAWVCAVGGGGILTTDQRNQAREWAQARTYGTVPRIPALASISEVADRRDTLTENIFGVGNGIPTSLGTVSIEASPPMTGLTNVATVEKLDVVGYDLGAYIYTPNSARTDVIIISVEGHSAAMGSIGVRDRVAQPAMTAGIPSGFICLPGGANDYTSGSPTQHLTGALNYDRWFGPLCVLLNRLLDRYPGARVIVTGISGGGWTSLVLGALDPRVDVTLSFVGWLPEHIHFNRDWEQWLNQTPTFGYMELALIAAADGRRCLCVTHEDDGVGFGKAVVQSRPPFAGALSDAAGALGGSFLFQYTGEDVSTTEDPHAYSVADQAILFAEVPVAP